jgi:hypothetical protein
MSWDETEKVAYLSSLPYFSFSSMHEVIGAAVLLNSFFFQNSTTLPRKLLMKLLKK